MNHLVLQPSSNLKVCTLSSVIMKGRFWSNIKKHDLLEQSNAQSLFVKIVL